MGYYDDESNVRSYEAMAEGYDGRALIERLHGYLAPGSAVLEIGMGPGKDLDILRRTYAAVGSDSSTVFVDRYRARVPEADVRVLDAVTLDTDGPFDAIYSNKVLQHLTPDDVRRSLTRQREIVAKGGVLMHALWYGEGEETHHGLRFVQYTEARFAALVPRGLSVVESVRYEEMAEGDSLVVVLRAEG